jgi:hypothetical protein
LAVVISPVIRISPRYRKPLLLSSLPISIIITVFFFYYTLEYRISVLDNNCNGFYNGIGDAILLMFVKKYYSLGSGLPSLPLILRKKGYLGTDSWEQRVFYRPEILLAKVSGIVEVYCSP